MRVAQYLTELPPQSLLEAKLHEAVRRAKEQLAARQNQTVSVDGKRRVKQQIRSPHKATKKPGSQIG